MKHNQKGFGAVETLLIIVILGLLGGVGWYVYQSQNKHNQKDQPASTTNEYKKEPEVKDETADWLSFTPDSKLYTVKLPDGWTFDHQNDECDCLLSKTLISKKGTLATIEKVQGGRDGGVGYFIAVDQTDKSAERFADQYTKIGEFKTAGLTGTKYMYEQTTEPEGIGLPKGSKEYVYYFIKDGKGIYISYSVTPESENQLELIEKSIKTIE